MTKKGQRKGKTVFAGEKYVKTDNKILLWIARIIAPLFLIEIAGFSIISLSMVFSSSELMILERTYWIGFSIIGLIISYFLFKYSLNIWKKQK